jgi:hypothetical protein
VHTRLSVLSVLSALFVVFVLPASSEPLVR